MAVVQQSKSVRRGLKYANKAALISDAPHHRVGAAIFLGRRLISIGWNSDKTHPDSRTRYNAHHAEFAAIIGNHKFDMLGASIFVVRLTPAGTARMAKPCPECQKVILAAGISKIFYTNFDGEVEKL